MEGTSETSDFNTLFTVCSRRCAGTEGGTQGGRSTQLEDYNIFLQILADLSRREAHDSQQHTSK